MGKILNLTPHPVHLVAGGDVVTVPNEPVAARVVLAADVPTGEVTIDGVRFPVVRTSSTGKVTGLPPQVEGTTLIVSRAVAEAAPERDDLVFPHLAVRDAAGAVIGCQALARR